MYDGVMGGSSHTQQTVSFCIVLISFGLLLCSNTPAAYTTYSKRDKNTEALQQTQQCMICLIQEKEAPPQLPLSHWLMPLPPGLHLPWLNCAFIDTPANSIDRLCVEVRVVCKKRHACHVCFIISCSTAHKAALILVNLCCQPPDKRFPWSQSVSADVIDVRGWAACAVSYWCIK